MLEKQKIIKMWHYNKEHNITGFIFPFAWDVMFNQMFISSDTMPLIEYIVSTIEDTTKQNFKDKVKLLPKDLPQHSIIDTNSKSDLLLSYPNGKKETKCILEMNSSHIMVMRNAFYAYKIASGGLKIKNGAYKKIFDTIVVNFNSYHHKSERLVEIGIFQTDFGKIIENSIKIINVNIYKALNIIKEQLHTDLTDLYLDNCLIMTTLRIRDIEDKNMRIDFYNKHINYLDNDCPKWYDAMKEKNYNIKQKIVFFLLKHRMIKLLDRLY